VLFLFFEGRKKVFQKQILKRHSTESGKIRAIIQAHRSFCWKYGCRGHIGTHFWNKK